MNEDCSNVHYLNLLEAAVPMNLLKYWKKKTNILPMLGQAGIGLREIDEANKRVEKIMGSSGGVVAAYSIQGKLLLIQLRLEQELESMLLLLVQWHAACAIDVTALPTKKQGNLLH